MCGICGIFNYTNLEPVVPSQIIRMYHTMKHRGPDDEGVLIEGPLGLGHCRLSIIDTSSRGKQPMTIEDGSITIIFNGEVYNYLELRKILSGKGYSFRTGTDTEVILKMYQEYREECLGHFIGMFTFAIWDRIKQKMFIARDRMGIKPFYYIITQAGMSFASEVKALLSSLPSRPSVNIEALDTYMCLGYVPGEKTIFQGIMKLLPGHYMVIADGRFTINQYWNICFEEEKDRGEQNYISELRELLIDASKLRLRSDVPLGVFLSGGLDSSAVVALLAQELKDPIKTFSVAYDMGHDFNETDYARIISKKFNTDHHELIVSPAEFQNFIPQYVRYMEEPVIEAAAISLYFIAKLAKDYVTVVLSGEGADEMFAGYPIYHYMQTIEKYRLIPKLVRQKILDPLLCKFGPKKISKYVTLSKLPLAERYIGVPLMDVTEKKALYSKEFQSSLNHHDFRDLIRPYFAEVKNQDALNQMLYLDVKTWLVDDLLIKADKMSMAPSLELRVPFLDHRIAEWAAKLPVKYKIKHGVTKYILKKAMEGLLPPQIVHRPKMGFPTPLQHMFQHELKTYAQDLLSDSRTVNRGYFDSQNVIKLLDEHRSGVADHHKSIWQLIVLEEWHRSFIDTM